jgi:predicted kinase
VYRLAYNGDIAEGQLAVFQGASQHKGFRSHRFQAPDQVIKRRLQHRNGASNEISDARLEDFKTLTEAYEPPTRTGEHNFLRVATDRSITAIIEETLKKLVLAGLGSSA